MSEAVKLTEAGEAMAKEAEAFQITLNELAERDLTFREIALLFNNHSRAMGYMDQLVEYQGGLIRTLMFTLAAYTKQYPLDLDKLEAGDLTPISTPPVTEHVEPSHFQHPGAYL